MGFKNFLFLVFIPNPGDTWSNLTSAYFSNRLIQPPTSDWIRVEIIDPLWIFGILMTKSVVAIGTASVCKNEPQNQQNPNSQRRFLAVVSPMKLEDCPPLGLSFKTVWSGSFGQRQANETPTVLDESLCNWVTPSHTFENVTCNTYKYEKHSFV